MKNSKKALISVSCVIASLVMLASFTSANEYDFVGGVEATLEVTEGSEEIATSEILAEETSYEEPITSETVAEETSTVELVETEESDLTVNQFDVVAVVEETEETEYVNLYDYETVPLTIYPEVTLTEYAITDINVRSVADPNGEVVTTVSEGGSVKVIAFSWESPWYLVEVNGVTGYVNSMNLLTQYTQGFPVTSEEDAEAIYAR